MDRRRLHAGTGNSLVCLLENPLAFFKLLSRLLGRRLLLFEQSLQLRCTIHERRPLFADFIQASPARSLFILNAFDLAFQPGKLALVLIQHVLGFHERLLGCRD